LSHFAALFVYSYESVRPTDQMSKVILKYAGTSNDSLLLSNASANLMTDVADLRYCMLHGFEQIRVGLTAKVVFFAIDE